MLVINMVSGNNHRDKNKCGCGGWNNIGCRTDEKRKDTKMYINLSKTTWMGGFIKRMIFARWCAPKWTCGEYVVTNTEYTTINIWWITNTCNILIWRRDRIPTNRSTSSLMGASRAKARQVTCFCEHCKARAELMKIDAANTRRIHLSVTRMSTRRSQWWGDDEDVGYWLMIVNSWLMIVSSWLMMTHQR